MTPEQFKETHQSGDAALLANARDLDRDAEAWYEEVHHDKAMEPRPWNSEDEPANYAR